MIACYLDKILLPKLKTFGVSNDFCNYTIETIERQMLSLIAHWDDIAFRKSVLLIGMEEGLFYEPTAKADIKAFVVVTIRNSPIETMQSDFYAESGLKAPLTNEQIKSITSDSIRFFNSLNFSSLSNSLKDTTLCQDYYYQILNNHPVTKNALEKLSTTSSKSLTYKPVEFINPYDLEELKGYLNIENKEIKTQTVVFDGFSLEIDPMLCQILQRLANQNQGVFIGDSFKFVTRNFEKLIKILEFILTHNICFVTPNYFIANGCVREPDNSTINLFKASLLDLALIVKHNNRYDYGIDMLRQEMLSNVDVRKTNFDKEITKRILTDNLILLIEPYWKKKIFGFFTISENIMETDLGEKYWSSELDYYLKNVLFLNPLNNFGRYAQASFEELQSISLSDENKKMFDSIVDDYKFCRRKVFEFDSLGTLSKREMCSVYCFLYSIFDKVAFLLKNVYEINVEEDIVDFTQGKLFDRKYKNSDKKFYEISNPAIIPIYLESVEGRSKNNIKGLDVGTFELNEFRNTLEHRSTSLIDENKLKGNSRILIKKIRNLILETYILLQSADTNMNSDDIVLCGTAYAKAIESVNKSQSGT